MSKLEDLVVSVEIAIKLHEARIKINSVFWWHECYRLANQKTEWAIDNAYYTHLQNKAFCDEVLRSIPAPTFEELDPIDMIFKDGKKYKLSIRKAVNHWVVSYNNFCDQNDTLTDPEYHFTNEHSLCEVMAEVMIQLKKKGVAIPPTTKARWFPCQEDNERSYSRQECFGKGI